MSYPDGLKPRLPIMPGRSKMLGFSPARLSCLFGTEFVPIALVDRPYEMELTLSYGLRRDRRKMHHFPDERFLVCGPGCVLPFILKPSTTNR